MLDRERKEKLKEAFLALVEKKGSIDAHVYFLQQGIDWESAQQLVKSCVKAGELVRLKNGKIAALDYAGFVCGPIEIKKDGFGFVRAEKGDVFIPEKYMLGALQGEKVLVKVVKYSRKGREGRVERILSRLPYRAVGRYFASKKRRPFVLLEQVGGNPKKVFLAMPEKKEKKRIRNGEMVVLDLYKRETSKHPAEGKIIEILGKENEPGVDILSIARAYGLYAQFPQKVEKEAARIEQTVDKEELAKRELLFDRKIFTIDGVDAKDLDDAVSLEITKKGTYLLGVHIADVSHYVHPGSFLDEEAFKRGTSVYLVDQVVPMLPTNLSNGICSLNEGVIRLTVSCFMEIDRQGKVISRRFCNSAIRSCHRLNYDEVNQLLEEHDPQVAKQYADIADVLTHMAKLAEVLQKKRHAEGNIDFDIPEAKIYLDEKKRPLEIKKRVQRTAEKLIEEFMICCNNTVAEIFSADKSPFLYRIHDYPDQQKLEALSFVLSNFGYRNLHITNKQLQKILEDCTGKAEEHLIKILALRAMKKAVYSRENHGHFGLGLEAYTHFTSPIRRYPDLIVHRLLKAKMGTTYQADYSLTQIAAQANLTERRAM